MHSAVNVAMIQRNWMLGKRIADEELKGESRAEYGKEVVTKLAEYLTENYGKGFDYSSLYKYIRFYKAFPQILDAASTKSLSLTWTHSPTGYSLGFPTLVRTEIIVLATSEKAG